MPQEVVRRFEMHVGGSRDLEKFSADLVEAVKRERGQVDDPEIKKIERARMLAVQLNGAAPAVARVKNLMAGRPDVRVLRDVIELTDGAAGGDVYPDQRVLLRIDPERGARAGSIGGSEAVLVAIVDSGIMVDHPDLRDHLWTGIVNGHRAHGARCIGGVVDHDVTDDDGHGTQLAGTILATADRAPGLKIMAVKFFDASTLPRSANAARAIDFAREQRADIINLSWDVGIGSPALERAVHEVCEAGALVVIAAGNNGTNNDRLPSIPAYYARGDRARTITVMATNRYDEKAAFSNYGAETVDLSAPGVGIPSTHPFLTPSSRMYRPYRGTSAAAAHVTGAAALLRSRDRSLTAERLKQRLVQTVDGLPDLKWATGGRLNLRAAL